MLPKSEFGKNVLKVMTGTSLGQVIPLLVAPVLTRIYSPAEFGAYYLLGALIAILVPTSTGRYELAILIPKRQEAAFHLVLGSGLLTVLFSLLLLVLIWIFEGPLVQFLGTENIRSWLYFVPLAVWIQGWQNTLMVWHNRHKRFTQLTVSKLLMTGFNAAGRVALGILIGGLGGLMLGTILGWAAGLLFLAFYFVKWDRMGFSAFQAAEMWEQLRRFRHFPQTMIAGTLFNKSAFELPSILLNKYYEASIAGFFGQMQSIIRRPLQVVGRAFEEVFKQKASEELQERGHCRGIFYSTFKRLSLLGILPFVLLLFFAPPLFALVFGEEWREAGIYTQIFALPYFFQFILAPLSSIFYLQERSGLYTIQELLQAILVLGGLFIGVAYQNPRLTMYLMALGYTLSFILRFLTLTFIIRGHHEIRE